MSIKSGLADYLSENAGIAALAGDRVYPVALPQNIKSRPAMTYMRLPSDHDQNIQKASGTSLGKFRLSSWGTTYKQADTLAEAARAAMQGFIGVMGDVTVSAVTLKNDYDDYAEPIDAKSAGDFVVQHEYHIRYTESIPTFS